MKIVLIRHTECIANELGVYGGQVDYELTKKGKKQLDKVIKYLYDSKIFEGIEHVYTSPLKRCYLLANKISKTFNLPFNFKSNLIETNFGIFEGLSNEEIKKNFKDDYEKWCNEYVTFAIPKGESLLNCSKRVSLVVNEIINKNKNLIIVAHGGIIKLIILNLLKLDLSHYWNFYCGNGSIIELSYMDDFAYIKNIINFNN
ncbi:histidine phosphatase family protein [Clostridium tarantellae]|uniref:histidine phosphatase family protein n=1 Tax=Clostridium tarantellae TaxID=39493 RepID=UPI001478C3B5|nr:histidine phosphatase family protein [Clostridium tarantellae]